MNHYYITFFIFYWQNVSEKNTIMQNILADKETSDKHFKHKWVLFDVNIFGELLFSSAYHKEKKEIERERERERTKHRLQKNFKPYIKEIFIYAPFLQTARIGKILCSRYSCIERMSIGNWVCACMCTCLPEIYTKPYIRVIMLITLDRSVP